MPEKPDGVTWEEYVYEPGTRTSEEYTVFVEEMTEQSQQAIRTSELNFDRYRIDERREMGVVYVWSDGWEMEVDDALRLRDALRTEEIGDDTVVVECNSRGPRSEVSTNLPSKIPRGASVKLRADIDESDELLRDIFGDLRDAERAASE